jgi:galactoside O-acetyltransferase
VIEKNVWIGAGTIVLPGVTIGENSVIGAGSVVTKSIPENVLALGTPCRVIRSLTEDEAVQM